jgi:hypothetical protein
MLPVLVRYCLTRVKIYRTGKRLNYLWPNGIQYTLDRCVLRMKPFSSSASLYAGVIGSHSVAFFLDWRLIPYSIRFWRMTQKEIESRSCRLALWHTSVLGWLTSVNGRKRGWNMIIHLLSHSRYGTKWRREAFVSEVISHVISVSEKIFIYT